MHGIVVARLVAMLLTGVGSGTKHGLVEVVILRLVDGGGELLSLQGLEPILLHVVLGFHTHLNKLYWKENKT